MDFSLFPSSFSPTPAGGRPCGSSRSRWLGKLQESKPWRKGAVLAVQWAAAPLVFCSLSTLLSLWCNCRSRQCLARGQKRGVHSSPKVPGCWPEQSSGKEPHVAVYEILGSSPTQTFRNLILISMPMTLKTKLTERPPLGLRLTSDQHTHIAQIWIARKTKKLKTELTFEP